MFPLYSKTSRGRHELFFQGPTMRNLAVSPIFIGFYINLSLGLIGGNG